jgi:hypothetical protein
MPLDHPPQLYIVSRGGDPGGVPRRVFGPYHDALFRSLSKSDIIDLWVRKRGERPVPSPLATRVGGLWEVHDGRPAGQCLWYWVSIRQITPEQACQLDATEGGAPQP